MKEKALNKKRTHYQSKCVSLNLCYKQLIFFAILLFAERTSCYAENNSAETVLVVDTIQSEVIQDYDNYKFSCKKLIVPVSLIATGAVSISFHDKLGEWGGPHKPFKMDDYIQYVPISAYLFTGFVGTNNRHNILQRMQIAATAYIIEACMVNAAKYTVKEQRPNSGAFNSFPSGHTATAIVGAELCRLEYGWKIGLPAYTVAILTAGLRVYNQRHWCNDLLAGAGIGILSANAAYWLYPLENRLFSKRKKNTVHTSCSIIPVYELENKTTSLAINLFF